MNQPSVTKKPAGMNIGSATLVMLFSVLCLTIFAVLSVVTAGNAWTMSEKGAEAVTAYYQADTTAVEILDQICTQYDGNFSLPQSCPSQIELVDGQERLNYWVSIDENQTLWVELAYREGAIQVLHWEVEASGTWEADQTLEIWGG